MSVDDDHKLFVAGLADTATEEGLRKLFESTGGSVSEVTVPRDRASGKPRGFAFVTMASDEDARSARQSLDGNAFEGRPLSVRPFRADRGAAPGAMPPRPGAPRDPRGFDSRDGRPEVRSGDSRSFERVSSQSREHRAFDSRSDDAPRSGAGTEAPRSTPGRGPAPGASDDSTLYIGNLPFDCSSAELEQLFTDRGFEVVRRIHLPMDPEGRARGFGFVALDSAGSARRAVEQLGDASVRGRRLSVSVARARGTTTGGSGGYPRATTGPTAGPRPPDRGSGQHSFASGSFAQAPAQGAAPRFEGPTFSNEPAPFQSTTEDESRRQGKWTDKDKDKKKEKKRKVKATPVADRAAKRPKNDAFRSTRAQDYVDDWDDD
jgi:nucleolin